MTQLFKSQVNTASIRMCFRLEPLSAWWLEGKSFQSFFLTDTSNKLPAWHLVCEIKVLQKP